MKGFFDTSVLVPVFYGDHVHHGASLELFIQFDKATGCCGAHSLAEVYSTLTRMPGKHRISGEQAMLFLNRRGYAPLTLCRRCGHRMQCPNCTAWLVEHRRQWLRKGGAQLLRRVLEWAVRWDRPP